MKQRIVDGDLRERLLQYRAWERSLVNYGKECREKERADRRKKKVKAKFGIGHAKR